ncbi:MAG: hypothetical protein GXO15_02430 [Crenarchaeota archaeon]|nr:hypothetical protein [Thermoproteota archaeon]
MRGGVHELLPIIVLAALGVAFAFIALNYMTSSWANVKPRSTEFLRLGVDSYFTRCSDGSGRLVIQVFNRGMHDIRVYRVEIVGYGWWVPGGYLFTRYKPGPEEACRLPLQEAGPEGIIIGHGFNGWLTLEVPRGVAEAIGPAAGYIRVRVYSEIGALFLGYVPVER